MQSIVAGVKCLLRKNDDGILDLYYCDERDKHRIGRGITDWVSVNITYTIGFTFFSDSGIKYEIVRIP